MRQVKSIEEALAVSGVIHIESGNGFAIAYQRGDEIPQHCKPHSEDFGKNDIATQDDSDESIEEMVVEESALQDKTIWKRIVSWLTLSK